MIGRGVSVHVMRSKESRQRSLPEVSPFITSRSAPHHAVSLASGDLICCSVALAVVFPPATVMQRAEGWLRCASQQPRIHAQHGQVLDIVS